MKGIVFNLLEACIVADAGEDLWDDVLESSGLRGAYTSLGRYDDEELDKLIGAISKRKGIAAEECERWFGRAAMVSLAGRFSAFFTPHRATPSFLLTLDDVIHAEVRKLYPGAETPKFEVTHMSADRGQLVYRSRRRMCAFAEGLIDGASEHFGERVHIERPGCMKRGDKECILDLSFTSLGSHG